jgi:hypothetical protein
MRMSSDERRLFPELARYLRDSMPQCANVSVIVNNLVKYGGMSVPQAREALRWGTDPYVYFNPESAFPNRRCSFFGNVRCAFGSSKPDMIVVNADVAEDFIDGDGMGKTLGGRSVPVVGVVLLHALCHWGNHKNKVTEKFEQGFLFEMATYGWVVG